MSLTDIIEVWRPVVGLEGLYEVSDLGRVRSLPRRMDKSRRKIYGGVVLRCEIAGNGYIRATMRRYRQRINRPVHHLVLEAFVGPCPSGMQGCHNDGVPSNNRLSNLRWDTPTNNHADKVRHGTMLRGETHPHSKLTEADVRTILESPEDASTLAERLPVCAGTIENIRRRKSWRHLTQEAAPCQPI